MKVEFTEAEKRVLESARYRIAGVAGITQTEDKFVIRAPEGAVVLRVENVTPGEVQPTQCYNCGSPYGLKPGTVEMDTGGEIYKHEAVFCTDCRCPK